MKLIIDVYYKNSKSNSFKVFREEIHDEDVEKIAKEKTVDFLPSWMDENWEYQGVSVDKIEL